VSSSFPTSSGSSFQALRTHLAIATLFGSQSQSEAVLEQLSSDRYLVSSFSSREDFCKFVEQEKQHLDCLIFQADADLPSLANWLHGQATLLPAVCIISNTVEQYAEKVASQPPSDLPQFDLAFTYHTAEVVLPADKVDQIHASIDQAIAQFIHLSPTCRINSTALTVDLEEDLSTQNFLLLKQRHLSEKLKERLGYLGVYYKRNPQNFFRHLPLEQKQELLDQLRREYRELILRYFANDGSLNQRIDDFVNTVFFTDIPVSQVVEIHMELMDEFSKQLKLEGRSEEILLDYRLTLIDTIAHLCEMYRRSIPREG
jgi:circadian clock protein KaiA